MAVQSQVTSHQSPEVNDLHSAIIQKYGNRSIPVINRKLSDDTGIVISDRYLAMIIRGERRQPEVESWLKSHFKTELAILKQGRKAVLGGQK